MNRLILIGCAVYLCILIVAVGTDNQKTTTGHVKHSQLIQLTSLNNLKDWKPTLTPRMENQNQVYDLEVEYLGDKTVEGGTIFLRVDTKEKLSGKTVKPDQTVQLSKVEPHMRIKLIGLNLPENKPIRFGLQWIQGTQALMSDGIFEIIKGSEAKNPVVYNLTFKGESKNWSAILVDNIKYESIESGRNSESSKFTLTYKGTDIKSVGKVNWSYEAIGGMIGKADSLQPDGTIVAQGSGTNVAVPSKESIVKVKVEWGGKIETFELKSGE